MDTVINEKFWQNIDKLILILLFLVTLFCAIWLTVWMMSNNHMDEGTLDWCRIIVSDLLSGLLGLMGGRAIEKAMNQKIEPHDNASVTVEAPKQDGVNFRG